MLASSRFIRSIALLGAVAVFGLLPSAAGAFDCTPIASFGCNQAHYDVLGAGAVPGELVCGNDYTGWSFQVFEFTVTAPSYTRLEVQGQDAITFGNLLVFADCPATTCLHADTDPAFGLNVEACFDVGTYTVVVATTASPGSAMAVGSTLCLPCDPVGDESTAWGALKSLYR